MASASERFLVISDLQIPFEHPRALEFYSYLKRHYRIPDDHVLNVGDEVDNLHGGLYPKDPDALHTPNGEIKAAKEKVALWARAFPKMKIAISNHGMRWFKKASAAEIPSQMIRDYREVLGMPSTWLFRDTWEFLNLKSPFCMIHGMGYSGVQSQRTAALDLGISVVHGHLWHAAISYIQVSRGRRWGMCVGACIDTPAYAFKFGKDARFKPCNGGGVILDSGALPIWLPIE